AAYLDTAAELLADLQAIEGFISVERFESITEPGKLLSLSSFENEEAVQRWRNTVAHRKAQAKGRNLYFSNYRLRIVQTLRDYGKHEREQAPEDSVSHHQG
ncbi:MAG: antibiotic biosynthesis monooxygenase, partial [Gammaproteobacteria bacterium]|nr:antibiotic biosynthesis monooxygenase [Gammaproteobacteria bacterium]